MALKRATEENLSIIVQVVVERVVIVDKEVMRGRLRCCCCRLGFGCWGCWGEMIAFAFAPPRPFIKPEAFDSHSVSTGALATHSKHRSANHTPSITSPRARASVPTPLRKPGNPETRRHIGKIYSIFHYHFSPVLMSTSPTRHALIKRMLLVKRHCLSRSAVCQYRPSHVWRATPIQHPVRSAITNLLLNNASPFPFYLQYPCDTYYIYTRTALLGLLPARWYTSVCTKAERAGQSRPTGTDDTRHRPPT